MVVMNKSQLVTFLKSIRGKGSQCKAAVIKEGVFLPGDIVEDIKRNIIGIVDAVEGEVITVKVYINEANLLCHQKEFISQADCRISGLDGMIRVQRIFNNAGFSWNRRKNISFKRKFEIRENQQVRLSILGRKFGYGVFKEIDILGRIVLYCLKLEGEDALFSLHEILGPAEEYQIDPISTYERKIFAVELATFGISWNGHLKQVERINYRMPKGGIYYYVNDMFEVVKTTDRYRQRDTKRLSVGNYFFHDKIADKFREFLSKEATRGISRSGTVIANGLKGINKGKLHDVSI